MREDTMHTAAALGLVLGCTVADIPSFIQTIGSILIAPPALRLHPPFDASGLPRRGGF